MTVSQPDGDGHSSSLALLIWLMMTKMVTMMLVFLPRLCPGICPGRASPLPSPLPPLDGNTMTCLGVPESNRRGKQRQMKTGLICGGRRKIKEGRG